MIGICHSRWSSEKLIEFLISVPKVRSSIHTRSWNPFPRSHQYLFCFSATGITDSRFCFQFRSFIVMSQYCSPYQFCTWFHIRFQSNEPGRPQSRLSHFSSRGNVKWLLIKSDTIIMFMVWLENICIYFYVESVAEKNGNLLISSNSEVEMRIRVINSRGFQCVRAWLSIRHTRMRLKVEWNRLLFYFIILSKVKFQLVNCYVMVSKFIQFTFIGQWLRTPANIEIRAMNDDNDEKETKSKYFDQ